MFKPLPSPVALQSRKHTFSELFSQAHKQRDDICFNVFYEIYKKSEIPYLFPPKAFDTNEYGGHVFSSKVPLITQKNVIHVNQQKSLSSTIYMEAK